MAQRPGPPCTTAVRRCTAQVERARRSIEGDAETPPPYLPTWRALRLPLGRCPFAGCPSRGLCDSTGCFLWVGPVPHCLAAFCLVQLHPWVSLLCDCVALGALPWFPHTTEITFSFSEFYTLCISHFTFFGSCILIPLRLVLTFVWASYFTLLLSLRHGCVYGTLSICYSIFNCSKHLLHGEFFTFVQIQ